MIAFIALVAAIGTGSAMALSGSNTVAQDDLKSNSVGGSEIKANSVGSSELKNDSVGSNELKNDSVGSNEVKPDSLTGDDINESSLNIQTGGGGGSNVQQFFARQAANETKTVTIGNFTVTSATNGAGTCGAIQLQAGNLDSQRSIGAGAAFVNLASNTTATITAANTSVAFAAVTDDGTSFVSGTVGRAQQGNTCLLTGYMTGV